MDNDRDQLNETECLLFQRVSKILNIPKSAFYWCPTKKKKKKVEMEPKLTASK